MERRHFLSAAGAAAAVLATRTGNSQAQSRGPSSGASLKAITRVTAANAGVMRGEMLYRQLGSTGVEVSAIGMGGAHLGSGRLPDADAIRLMHEGIDRGINFMDNCWDYNGGRSETRMGDALAQGGYRQKVFLMTKI